MTDAHHKTNTAKHTAGLDPEGSSCDLFGMPEPGVVRLAGGLGTFVPDDLFVDADIRLVEFLDQEKCRRWVISQIHREGPACPYCRVVIEGVRRLWRFWTGERLTCRDCGRFFTATTGSFISGIQMSPRELFLLALLFSLGVTDTRISGILGRSVETVRLWRRRFKAIEAAE